MTPEEALQLIKQGEGQRVEFKTGFAEEDKGIESLCAFANADGGTVFFGVRPDGQVLGVDVGGNTIENLANKINRSLYPQAIPRIELLAVDDKAIVVVTVDRAGKGNVIFTGRPLCRSGRTNQQMSWDETRNRILGEESAQDFWLEPGAPTFRVNPGVDAATSETVKLLMTFGQTSGEEVAPVVEWSGANVEGTRPPMPQNQPPGARFQKYQLKPVLARPSPPEDEAIFDIRFRWRGATRQYRWAWPLFVR
jgi:hypothetical protein